MDSHKLYKLSFTKQIILEMNFCFHILGKCYNEYLWLFSLETLTMRQNMFFIFSQLNDLKRYFWILSTSYVNDFMKFGVDFAIIRCNFMSNHKSSNSCPRNSTQRQAKLLFTKNHFTFSHSPMYLDTPLPQRDGRTHTVVSGNVKVSWDFNIF